MPKNKPSSPAAVLGRRERNKQSKERAIREAARKLFVEKGFEATTLREVADLADVGFGTVFAYANDKAGLLAMVFVAELKTLPPLFAQSSGADVLNDLITALAHLYRFWADIPTLSRHVLQQMEFFGDNPHLAIIVARRQQARDELATWLVQARTDGRIDADVDIDSAADTLFAIYTSAVREWSVRSPHDVDEGKRRLQRLMRLPVVGMTRSLSL